MTLEAVQHPLGGPALATLVVTNSAEAARCAAAAGAGDLVGWFGEV